jgi:hypothetical protein
MSAFEVYKDYVALKNHFNKPDYDYFKYNGKSRTKLETFNKRKDKIFFEKLAKNKEFHDFLVSNLSENPKLWIRDLAYSDEAQKRHLNWKKRQQSLSYMFKSDLSKLDDDFDSNLLCKNGHPNLLKLYLGSEISLETLCIVLKLTKSMKYWNKSMEYDPIWEDIRNKVQKYLPFLKYDEEKFKEIVIDKFTA